MPPASLGGLGLTSMDVSVEHDDPHGMFAHHNVATPGPSRSRSGTKEAAVTFKSLLGTLEALHNQELNALKNKYEHMIANTYGSAMTSRCSAPEGAGGGGGGGGGGFKRDGTKTVDSFSGRSDDSSAPDTQPISKVLGSSTNIARFGMKASVSTRKQPENMPTMKSEEQPPPTPTERRSQNRGGSSVRYTSEGREQSAGTPTAVPRTSSAVAKQKAALAAAGVVTTAQTMPTSEAEAEEDCPPQQPPRSPRSIVTGGASGGFGGAASAGATASSSSGEGAGELGVGQAPSSPKTPRWSYGAQQGQQIVELSRSAPVKLVGSWDITRQPTSALRSKRIPELTFNPDEGMEDDMVSCPSPTSPKPARTGRWSDRDSIVSSGTAHIDGADPGLREQVPHYFGTFGTLCNIASVAPSQQQSLQPDPETNNMATVGHAGTHSTAGTPAAERTTAQSGGSRFIGRLSAGSRFRGSYDARGSSMVGPTDSCFGADFSFAGTKSSRFVLSPVGAPRLIWDGLTILALMIDMWITPFEIVFTDLETRHDEVRSINIAVMLFFMVDIVLNFNTGYVNLDRLVMTRKEIMLRYFQGYFLLDLVATVPWDLFSSSSSLFGMTRLVKVTKLVKVLRFFRLVRMRRMKQASRFQPIIVETLRYPLKVFQMLAFVFFTMHIHSCMYGEISPDYEATKKLSDALVNYSDCLKWAYTVFFVGSSKESLDSQSTFGLRILETCLVTVRVILDQVVGAWLVIMVLDMLQDTMKMSAVKSSVLKFFRQHKLSTQMQIQVMYTLHETKAAREMQRNFNYLMAQHVPLELRRAVSEELWTRQLLTLGLIVHIRAWHSDLLMELSMLVREEVVSSKSVLCKAGSLSIAAYHVMKGQLAVEQSGIPDFGPGMWVGERALLSPNVRRTWTVVARTLSALMSVPSAPFADLLHRLGLEERFKAFVEDQVALGLCGRCGDLGDHFTHACPLAELALAETNRRRSSAEIYHALKSCFRRTPPKSQNARRRSSRRYSEELSSSQNGGANNRELQSVLHAHRLTKLMPILKQLGVEKSADIATLSPDALEGYVGNDSQLRARVDMLRMSLGYQGDDDNVYRRQHLIFLSHYKLEAGTEAALVRTEIENIFKEQPGTPAEVFEAPVFLDSEDLNDLEDLVHRVDNTHNVLVLLTKNIFCRPWVLVEVVTARRSGVRCLPVDVQKPGDNKFQFPDEMWYASMLNGEVLGEEGTKMLADQGIGLDEVVASLRELLKKIAMPYSPHRSASIRRAEVMAVLKQCRFQDQHDHLHSVLTRLGEPGEVAEETPAAAAASARRRALNRMRNPI